MPLALAVSAVGSPITPTTISASESRTAVWRSRSAAAARKCSTVREEVKQTPSSVPFVASHSNARAICDHERNLYDDQIRALADKGGLMGINFARHFLVEDASKPEDVSLDQMVDHVDHIVNLVGVDHVALGSDYDGASMPAELYDAAQLPKLIDKLRERGYGDEAIQKFGRENWLRVLKQAWG